MTFARTFVLCAAATAAVNAGAQDVPGYPSRPVRLIVPYAPGGPSDILGRLTGQLITEASGQPVIVENRAGAAGDVGTAVAAKATPDGHNLNVVGISYAVAPSMKPDLRYKHADFAPVALLSSINNVLVVHASLPATSVKSLIALAKSRRGQITFMSGGAGGGQHLAGELFNSMAGVQLTHVPYKGSAPGLTALLSGEVIVGFADMLITLPHVRSEKLRALAVTGPTRSTLLPAVPTIAEAALPDYSVTLWFGLLAPAGTRPEIVRYLNRLVVEGSSNARNKGRLAALGAEPSKFSPDQFAAFLKQETVKWDRVVRAAKITME